MEKAAQISPINSKVVFIGVDFFPSYINRTLKRENSMKLLGEFFDWKSERLIGMLKQAPCSIISQGGQK
jgi:hypothetical protein